MTKGQNFEKKGKHKHGPCNPMSNSALDLNTKGEFLKMHEKCPKPNCHKQINFTSRQNQLERAGFEKI